MSATKRNISATSRNTVVAGAATWAPPYRGCAPNVAPSTRNIQAQQKQGLWRNIHHAVHDEARWLDSVHDFADWLELYRPMCLRNDEGAPSLLWNTAEVDAAKLQFLLLIHADPVLEIAGLSTTETITYVLHSTFGFSQSEIAVFRRVKEGTVKQTLHRATKKLAVEDAA